MLTTKQLLYVIVLVLLFSGACKEKAEDKQVEHLPEKEVYDLKEIKEQGVLKALVDYSSTSYFVYKGTPMGFEYDLLSRFAKSIEVDLKVIPVNDLESIIDSLNEYKGDLIAANLTRTKGRSERVNFTIPVIRTKQVLVQRQENSKKNNAEFIEYLDELIGKEVYVQKGSSFYKRLQNLSDDIGGDVLIKEVAGNVTVEELIKRVSEGEIDYTIADEHVAKINKAYFRNIHIKKAVGVEQQLAWAVRKESPDLMIAINEWLSKFRKTIDYRVIYLKYYGNTSIYKKRVKSDLFTSKSGQISPYDQLIKKHAESIDWDWRLLTSLIYQESQFDHYSSSWLGAQGLMQLMPTTAHAYGIDSSATPEENVRAGVEYLKWLDKQFTEKVEDEEERRLFILAAYNVGLGHVFDAIRLAEKYELNPEKWEDNVAEMLLNKAKPEYYKDDVVHYGYCRGSEPYKYVSEIMDRYQHYKNITDIAE